MRGGIQERRIRLLHGYKSVTSDQIIRLNLEIGITGCEMLGKELNDYLVYQKSVLRDSEEWNVII